MKNLEFVDLLDKGGLLVWPILLCSLIGTTIFFERLLRYRRFMKRREDLNPWFQFIREGKFELARENLRHSGKKPNPEKLILTEALSVDEPDRETLEMVLVHSVEREMASMSRYLNFLAVLGSTAPLLGLLGTVLGMIKAFSVVESMGGMVNASVLAGGIWEAMLTTAFGLVVAIPLMFFHNHLESRLQSIREYLEEVAITFMKAWTRGHNLRLRS